MTSTAMLDYVYRKDLLSADVLRQLSARSNFAGILHLVCHLALIAVTGTLVMTARGSWWLLPAWIIHGLTLTFLFCMLHETIHATAFRWRVLNSLVARTIGFLLLLPAGRFRLFHFAHHRHTRDPDLDPEEDSAKPKTFSAYAWHLTGFGSYWWPQLKTLILHCVGSVEESYIPELKRQPIIAEALWHAGLYLLIIVFSVVLQTTVLLHLWVIPILFGMIALRGFLLAEHAGCDMNGNMLENTRTTMTNPFVRFLTWNMSYHCEHHAFPGIPFHKLPALHKHMKQQPRFISTGYIEFHSDYVKSLRP